MWNTAAMLPAAIALRISAAERQMRRSCSDPRSSLISSDAMWSVADRAWLASTGSARGMA
jgi:hypothetical protein